jgi:hypothetical protein
MTGAVTELPHCALITRAGRALPLLSCSNYMLNRSQSQPHREHSVSDNREIFTEDHSFATLCIIDSRRFGGAYSLAPSAAGRVARTKYVLFIMRTKGSYTAWMESCDSLKHQLQHTAETVRGQVPSRDTCGGHIYSC